MAEKYRVKWSREETILAFDLYCKVPFSKISKTHDLLVVETDGTTRRIEQIPNKNERIVDAETGEILSEDLEPNDTVISKLFEIFGNTLEIK